MRSSARQARTSRASPSMIWWARASSGSFTSVLRPPRRSPHPSTRLRRDRASRAAARRLVPARGTTTRVPTARTVRAHPCPSRASPRAAAGTAVAGPVSLRDEEIRPIAPDRIHLFEPRRIAQISIERESSCPSNASSSASSTTTYWPFDASQPLTISSGPTSRSCLGHQRFCLIGVRHSRCRSRNETSDWRAAGFVAGASPTGMLTSPKLSDPFQVVRMTPRSIEGPDPHSRPGFAVPARERPEPGFARFPLVSDRSHDRHGSGATPSRRSMPVRRTSSSTTTTGTRFPGPRPQSASRTSRTGCSRAACARVTRSRSLARTTLDWALFDFALAQVGAVGAPVYANNSPQDVAYVLDHSESVGVLCEDAEQRREGRGGTRVAARACGTC